MYTTFRPHELFLGVMEAINGTQNAKSLASRGHLRASYYVLLLEEKRTEEGLHALRPEASADY